MVEQPLISIITVTFNAEASIEQTILSVINQTFSNIEYIIVDGASKDGTIDIINKYRSKIDLFISEKDRGIYDAMNKGIDLSTGDWLLFMNSGDRLVNENVISDTFSQLFPDCIDLIYSDWFLCDFLIDKDTFFSVKANYEKGYLLHQSVIYKKKLHNEFGKYIVTDKLIISDYIFFNIIPKERYFKSAVIISVNDRNGITSKYWAFEQKVAVDFVFHRITFLKLIYEYARYIFHRLRKGKLTWN